jgi:tellurite resistance protein
MNSSERRDDDILWAALGEPGTTEQRRAVVAAFALMTVADGEATAAEVLAFRRNVSDSKVFAAFDLPGLLADFDDLVARLLRHEPGALTEVNERLKGADDPDSREVVLAAARAALVADGADADREEVVIAHIARQIGAPVDAA